MWCGADAGLFLLEHFRQVLMIEPGLAALRHLKDAVPFGGGYGLLGRSAAITMHQAATPTPDRGPPVVSPGGRSALTRRRRLVHRHDALTVNEYLRVSPFGVLPNLIHPSPME
jgi:hypothetical protein